MDSEFYKSYFQIVEKINKNDGKETYPEVIEFIRSSYGLKTIAYFGMNVSNLSSTDPFLAVTYSPSWIEHYKARNYVTIDPVIKDGFSNLLPVEWSAYKTSTAKLKTFFGEATEFGVGRNGMTFAVRGMSGDRALFTITTDASPREWNVDREYLKRDFQMLAYHVHNLVLRSESPDRRPAPKLAPREIECLKWKASGKTDWETAMILGITEKTVRFYLDLARSKLDATNITHAVVKALNHNIILLC
jgi:DNA-binding CsgD family transcriptional regulator